MPQPNGPRPTPTTGRNRNTVVNNAGKKRFIGMPGGLVPPVSPDSALSLGSASASNQYNYLAELARLRQEKAALRGAFIQSKAQNRENRIGEAVGAESSALQRGLVGSSIDLMGRAAAVTGEAEANAAARSERNLGLLGVSQGMLQNQASFYQTQAEIDAQRRVEQALSAVDLFGSDGYDAVQQDYGAIFRQLLAAIKARKAGQTVGRRRGLEQYDRLRDLGSTPEGAARLAHLLREGL